MNQRHKRRRQAGNTCDCLRPLIRIFGMMTAFVVCGVGVDIYLHGYHAGLYTIGCALFIFVVEAKWIVTIFLELLLSDRRRSGCLACWSLVRYAGGWYPAPPYIVIATALMLWPHNLWLSHVAGIMLILQSLLRFGTLALHYNHGAKHEELLPQCDFEKLEARTDIAEDCFVDIEPISLDTDEPIEEFDD